MMNVMNDPYRSFSNDFNTCLFGDWVTDGVLSNQVTCTGQKLCYGKYGGTKALFAVCYNTDTLIPEFSGNVIQSGGTVGEKKMIDPPDLFDGAWKADQGLVQAGVAVAVVTDYDPYNQGGKFLNYDSQNNFLAKGHLTPNGDFKDDNSERSFTYITTNIAPQWQPFNAGNWAKIESAVTTYAKNKGRTLYVFTGTGGRAKYNSQDIKLNGKVLTPKYYWKAVCDPVATQSIVFVAENSPGEIRSDANSKVAGCNGIEQTPKLGIVYCYSLEVAAQEPGYADFKLPPFSPLKCQPSNKGNFMDSVLNKLE